MEFVRQRCPEEIDRVHAIMKRRGAYGRYKELLAEKKLLEAWYAFENDRTKEALLAWCKENGVEFKYGGMREPILHSSHVQRIR